MRLIGVALTLLALAASPGAQAVRLRDVVARVDRYLEDYEQRLASVVAEESYRQWVEKSRGSQGATLARMLRSDFALTLVSDRNRWVGYRDTFEVDGFPVRDREERLQRLLSSGAIGQAARIADQNARFNLGEGLLARNINVPTFALEIMHPRFRDRVKVRRTGADVLDGRAGWLIEFREQDRLTYVRTPEGRDQPSHVVALVDVETGEVLRTVLTWPRMKGSVTVTYGPAPGIPASVPVHMAERYPTPSGAIVAGEARYDNFRQFQTSARIIR